MNAYSVGREEVFFVFLEHAFHSLVDYCDILLNFSEELLDGFRFPFCILLLRHHEQRVALEGRHDLGISD